MKRLTRRLLLALLSLVLLVVSVPALLALAASSEAGSRRILHLVLTAAGSDDVALAVDEVSGTLASGLRLQGLRYAAADGSASLVIREIEFAWQPWLLLQRRLRLDALRVEGLNWRSRSSAPTPEPFDARDISNWFAALPLELELREAGARDLLLDIDTSLVELPLLAFSATLDAQRLVLSALELELFDTRISGAASLQRDLRLTGALDWRYGPEAAYAGQLQLAGSLPRLELRHEMLQPWAVSSSGALDTGLVPGQPLHLEFLHSLAVFDLAPYGVDDLQLSGLRLVTRGEPERIELAAALTATHAVLGPLAIEAEGLYTPELLSFAPLQVVHEDAVLQAAGSWRFDDSHLQLDWTLTRLALERGGIRLADGAGGGSVNLVLSDAGVDAELLLGPLTARLDEQELTMAGELQVRQSQLAAVTLQLAGSGNTLTLAGSVQPALVLEWALTAPALAQLHASLGGDLAGSGTVTGTLGEPLLQGRLQGRDLQIQLDADVLALQRLDLDATTRAGQDNALTLQLAGLALQRGSSEPQVLVDTGTAALRGTPAAHALQVQLAGPGSTVAMALDGSLDDAGWNARVTRAALTSPWGDWQLQQATTLALQDGTLRVDRHCWNTVPVELCLAVSGSSTSGYDLQVDAEGLPLAWLNRAADAGDNKPAGLQELQSAQRLDLPPGLSLQGSAALQARIGGLGPDGPAVVRAELRGSGLEVVLQSQDEPVDGEQRGEPQRFAIAAEPLVVTLEQAVWRARTDLAITQAPDADLAAVFQGSLGADLTLDREQRLGGVVRLAFADLAFIETLVPGLQKPAGRLQGQAQLAGTLSEPELDADVVVSDGAFTLPALGIDVREFGATLHSSRDAMNLRATAASGDGTMALDATLLRPLAADREFSARLEGSNFRLLDTAAASATVSPAVDLRYLGGMLALDGRVLVPQASLDLESVVASVADGGVKLSRDAVVVQPDAAALVAEQQQALPFDAQLALQLGDAVQVRGFGLDARLNGDLRLEQEADRPLLAYGELGIPQGSYRIYNQELNARDGRLIFYGNPVNPMLDVRAYRETSTAEVGMLLSGTFERMQSRLYSTPTLPDNEILALLITGKSFNNMNDQDGNALLSAVANFGIERGEGLASRIGDTLGFDSLAINSGSSYVDSSLGLGKYITPDLLMRYEIGLFDRQAVLSIDYSLTTRLKLELRSGLNQSIDISYTIEKD